MKLASVARWSTQFFISTSYFLSMVVLIHFLKLRLKWCLAGALLEQAIDCRKVAALVSDELPIQANYFPIVLLVDKID